MNVREFLILSKSNIDTPEKWTQGVLSRDAEGKYATLKEGVCFCALGALDRASLVDGAYGQTRFRLNTEAEKVLRDVLEVREGYRNVATFNDRSTHAEVMELFDAAIAEAGDE